MTCEPWPVDWPCCVDNVSGERQDAAAQLAATLLGAMAGGRILGACTYHEDYLPTAGGGECGVPYLDGAGHWHNGGRGGNCCRILLEHRPVRSIESVTVAGIVLDAADYRLDGGWLVRVGACWPISAAMCDVPTVRVEYTAGAGWPAGTALAVGEVACEYLNAMDGKACKLPSRAVTITRQGVTVNLGDAGDFIAAGRLGLPIADAWLRAVNPTGHKVRPKVYSPDLPRMSRVRTP
jgi:hypothetical protein